MSNETFKVSRRGRFQTTRHDPEAIKKEIQNRLGQGDWEISWSRSGQMVGYTAVKKEG